MSEARVAVPATIGNVASGFDTLGLAIEGLEDKISVKLSSEINYSVTVRGRDAAKVPLDPEKNCAVIAARSLLHRIGLIRGVHLAIERHLPISGGLGSSAAASLGGAYAAALAAGVPPHDDLVLGAALDGEAAVAGRHLDNLAPCWFGGVCLVKSVDPITVYKLPLKGHWWIVVVSPALELPTAKARAILPQSVPRDEFIAQLASVSALSAAFASGDPKLARVGLVDHFAEPRRRGLIPCFHEVRDAALHSGALGFSISGAGPSLFAMFADRLGAEKAGPFMLKAAGVGASLHINIIAERGAHPC